MSKPLAMIPGGPVGLAVTMTSLELVDFINSEREELARTAGATFPSKGFAKLEHADFLKKVPEVLGACAGNFSGTYQVPGPNGGTRAMPCYRFPKRESCLMAMSYSYALQAKVFDHMTDLEQRLQTRRSAPALAAPVQAALSEQLGIGQLFGVPVHLAQVEACKNVKAATGVDLSPWLALAPAQDNLGANDVFLEPADIGARFGIKPAEVNDRLAAAGLQVKVCGTYKPTPKSGGNAQLHQWTKGSKSGVNLKWRVSFVKAQLGLREAA